MFLARYLAKYLIHQIINCMVVYNVSYDLNKSGKNYNGLYDEIKKTDWAHILDSTWLVSTNETATQLRERLRTQMDDNDYLFVSKVNKTEYDGWLNQKYWDWLIQHL